jgi:hypothetical protein
VQDDTVKSLQMKLSTVIIKIGNMKRLCISKYASILRLFILFLLLHVVLFARQCPYTLTRAGETEENKRSYALNISHLKEEELERFHQVRCAFAIESRESLRFLCFLTVSYFAKPNY